MRDGGEIVAVMATESGLGSTYTLREVTEAYIGVKNTGMLPHEIALNFV